VDEAKKSNDQVAATRPNPYRGFEVNRVEGAVIYANDPILGIMHYERDRSPAFVFDLMEPERPKALANVACRSSLTSEPA
jgi:hypothetical protein